MNTQQETLKSFNNKLLTNASTIKATRIDTEVTTKEVVKYLLNGINDESVIGTTKKDKINFILKMELEGMKSKEFSNQFKLAIKVARLKLIDDCKIREDLLSNGQLTTLINEFSIETINDLFSKSTIDTYVETIKNHFKENRISITSQKVKGDKIKKARK
jgi:hypothetical protein